VRLFDPVDLHAQAASILTVGYLNIIFSNYCDNCISLSAKLKFQYQIARK